MTKVRRLYFALFAGIAQILCITAGIQGQIVMEQRLA